MKRQYFISASVNRTEFFYLLFFLLPKSGSKVKTFLKENSYQEGYFIFKNSNRQKKLQTPCIY